LQLRRRLRGSLQIKCGRTRLHHSAPPLSIPDRWGRGGEKDVSVRPAVLFVLHSNRAVRGLNRLGMRITADEETDVEAFARRIYVSRAERQLRPSCIPARESTESLSHAPSLDGELLAWVSRTTSHEPRHYGCAAT